MNDRHQAKLLNKKKQAQVKEQEAQSNAQRTHENLLDMAAIWVPQSKEHARVVLSRIVEVALAEGWAEAEIHTVVDAAARDFRVWLNEPGDRD